MNWPPQYPPGNASMPAAGAAVFRAFGGLLPERSDLLILVQYVGLVLAFAVTTTITVPGL